MAKVRLTTARRRGVTEVSDIFIDSFMNDANEVQLKLYLYLLRHSSVSGALDISGMADALNFSERDIIRALDYWEKKRVLHAEYSAEKTSGRRDTEALEGIQLFDPSETAMDEENRENSNIEKKVFSSGDFSPEDVERFADDPDTKNLITAAQLYFGRPVGVKEIQIIMYMVNTLGFDVELVDYLMQKQAEQGLKDFKSMEQTAGRWQQAGISTVAQAKEAETGMKAGNVPDEREKRICALLGRTKNITPGELEAVRKWTGKFGFPDDVIEEACRRTVMNVEDHRFAYAESILQDWFYNGVRSMDDIAAMDEAFRKNSKQKAKKSVSAASAAKTTPKNFDNAARREYDYNELEKKLTGK
jgi:DnaD/phage-associated family protein